MPDYPKLDAVYAEAEKKRKHYANRFDLINEDPDLNASAKRRKMGEIEDEAKQEFVDLRKRFDNELQAERLRQRERLFGVSSKPEEQANHRLALSMAGAAEKLEPLARQARDTGDKTLMKAVAYHAYGRGDRDALDIVRAAGSWGERLGELAGIDALDADKQSKLEISMHFRAPTAPKVAAPARSNF